MSQSKWAIHVCPRRASLSIPAGMRAAVSLHSHSECSRESLASLPGFLQRMPALARLYAFGAAEYRRLNGRALDLSEWYWRPPATPAAVIVSEREHLEQRLQMEGFVSLSDHDTVEG